MAAGGDERPPWPFTEATVVINCTKEDYDRIDHYYGDEEWSKSQGLELAVGDVITNVKLPPPDFKPPTLLLDIHDNGWYHGQLRETEGVFNAQYVQFRYSCVQLTLQNVTTAINNVEWISLCNCLYVPESKRRHIEQQASERHKRMLVEWWLLTDPAPSWRRLISHLDYYGDPLDSDYDPSCLATADLIRHNAEPVHDTTFTLTNVMSALETVQEWEDLGRQLGMPWIKRFSEDRHTITNYYMTSCPGASWSGLAAALYCRGEHFALTEVTSYFQRQPEPTLTASNLYDALEEVEELDKIAIYLNIPLSKQEDIKSRYSGENQRKQIIKEFINNHPAPSWRLVAEMLYKINTTDNPLDKRYEFGKYLGALQTIKQKYLKGKQLFNEAMKHGHVKSCNTAALFVGAAGSGKTCSKHVIMNEQPPEVRVSTPIAERPVKVMKIRTVEGIQWHRLSPADQKEILANIMALIAAEEGETSDQATPTTEASAQASPARPSLKARLKALLRLRHGRSHSGWSLKRTKHASPSKLKVNVASHGSSTTLDSDKTGDTSTPKQSSTSDNDKPVGLAEVEALLESSATETELARMIELSRGTEEQLEVNLVHITDSGGQPQFHEVLPVFLRRASIYIFVTKLSESLDERPLVMYFDSNGNLISKPFPATHTNMQIFRHCIRTLQSHRSQRGGKAPYIMIIGTHQDLEHLCSKTREAKNHKLAEVLLPDFQDEVIYFNKELIFPLNAKSPGKDEWEIAEEIRKIIMLKCAAEPDDIPLRWYCLELKLQEIAEALGRAVMSKEECFAVALRLHFDSESFQAALEYLDGLNIIFYYPDTLPDVVFTDPQVLLDKVTELVKLSYELKEEDVASKIKARGGEFQKFQEHALVTSQFLKSFGKHYVPNLFTPLELVMLFRALLIFADFSRTEYFMPCLLEIISSEEVDKHRVNASADTVPLVLHFPHGGPLLGMFCSLLVYLLSAANRFPSPWKLVVDDLGIPKCLYRNCVRFTIPRYPGTVTLVDSFGFFEVHVDSSGRFCQQICCIVQQAMFAALKKAASNLHYSNSQPELAFLCPCSREKLHPATLGADGSCWICTLDSRTYKDIDERQQMWLPNSAATLPRELVSVPPMYPRPREASLTDKILCEVLTEVLDWHTLGTNLGLPVHSLGAIQLDYSAYGTIRQKQEMISKWLSFDTNASWSKLASALEKMGNHSLAKKVQDTYSPGVRLTLQNVTTAINNVNWEAVCNCLCVPESKRRHIEQQASEHHRRMLGEWWLLTDPAPSWRRLISRLDSFSHDPSCTATADLIRHNAEPIQDTTFTLTNVLSTLETVQEWRDLGSQLAIPWSKHGYGKKATFNYYITSMPSASWQLIAGALYYRGEQTALTKVSSYFQRQPEPTLTASNLHDALEEVKELDKIAIYLNVPESKQQDISSRYSRDNQRKHATIEEFINIHPAPSWRLVAELLYRIDTGGIARYEFGKYLGALQTIKRKYLKGKQLFNEAMKHGHVKSCNTAALFVGAAGSGKTCSKHVIMNEEPPEVRVSTPIAERPVKVMKIRTVEGIQWHRLSPADQKEILANIMALIAAEEGESSDQATPTTEASAQASPTTETSAQASPARPSLKARLKALLRLRHGRSHSGWSLKRTKHASPSKLKVNVASHGSSSTLTAKPVGVAEVEALLESSATETELARMIELSRGTEEQLEVNLVHITDSGGQPQFHEVLPVFLRRASIYIFITKLSESLDERPLVMYYDSNGNLISKPFPATHTNMQIFRHCIRTLQSHRWQRGAKAPYIMIIGTHQDLEHLCSETREAKNHRIAEVLLPEFQDEVIYFKVANKEFIFPLNAKSPGNEEWEIGEEIRKIIMLKCAAEPDDIPLRWYCLELKLQEIAQALGREVMRKEECFAVALRLHFDSESFEVALEYLDGLNIIFYYPDTLPDVVFTDPQVLLDKVTELVKLSYELKEEDVASKIKARGGEFQKFQDHALVTSQFLKSFGKHYVPNLFTPLELVKLFRALLIFADFSDTEYFVPCLLEIIGSEEVDKHRVNTSADTVPLVLHFPHGGPLLGMFCSLLVYLLSAANRFPSPWKLVVDGLGTPKCLYRNCVRFTIPLYPGTVTLVDSFSFFEVHVHRSGKVRQQICSIVRQAMFAGLKKAASNLHYSNSQPQLAFLCPCSREKLHPATVGADGSYWICTLDSGTSKDNDERQQMWLPYSAAALPRELVSAPPTSPGSRGLLPPNPKLKDLINLRVSDWNRLGLALELDSYDLDIIEKDNPGDRRKQTRKMFQFWLKTQPDASYKQLIKALHEVGDETVASFLCKKYGIRLPPPAVYAGAGSHPYQSTMTGGYAQQTSTPEGGMQTQPPQPGYVPQSYQQYPQDPSHFLPGPSHQPGYPHHGYPPPSSQYPPHYGYYCGQPAPSTQLPLAGSSHHAGIPPHQYTHGPPMQGPSYQGNI